MATIQKTIIQQTNCARELVAVQIYKMLGNIGENKKNTNATTKSACGCARGRTPQHLPLANRTLPERTARKSPQQHNNQSYAWCHGVLSVRSLNMCLLSSHVGVHLGSLQQKQNLDQKETADDNKYGIQVERDGGQPTEEICFKVRTRD